VDAKLAARKYADLLNAKNGFRYWKKRRFPDTVNPFPDFVKAVAGICPTFAL
jgi:hypothetical protein